MALFNKNTATTTISTSGWGPVEIDRSNGNQPAGDGKPITLQGTVYPKGLGVHAASTVEFHLGKKCSTVTTWVGVDDEVGDKGSVVFRIFADATLVADSGTLTGASAAKVLNADVADAEVLRLEVTNAGDNVNSDHADWAHPRLTCA